ncbi:ParB/RepB/Spo0J family partition protein [Cerasicoccus maritimus]|uniref:ParB/RepB/Spo0J family partition protein n=1 Tax=Cerasicoccus maritimus TaxID=490089 RepID=UPI00285266DB|nr:plasmid partitioning protein RepB C-terminal domain-containing protein [Cerasicoccus maritimus]
MANKSIRTAFDLQPVLLPLESLIEVRPIRKYKERLKTYDAILSSIKEVGIIQPMVVCPIAGDPQKYKLLDGHLRLYALRELGEDRALCIISMDDERYTFDAQVNHINPIQQNRMLKKAVKDGVDPERIAAALGMSVKQVIGDIKMLDGINPEVVEILKDRPICSSALRLLCRVKPIRQIEIAENMCAMNNFTITYAKALVVGTKKEFMVNGQRMKTNSRITPEIIAKTEKELELLQTDFEQMEQAHSDNVYKTTVIKGYLKKLLVKDRIRRFLEKNYPDILPELDRISAMDSLGS